MICKRFVQCSMFLIHGKKISSGAATTIPGFYKEKSVLITGCTGFLGQGLTEKLLRSCPDIGRIYVPIKPNKHGNTEQRFQKLVQYEVFDELRKLNPGFSEKLIPFDGDLTHENMGLRGEVFAQMIDEVSVIFHGAALIKLNPSLRESVEANVIASKNVLQFGKQCRQLCAYIHVSSVFTNVELDHIKEEIYPTAKSPDELTNLIKNQSDDALRRNEKRLIETAPMVYLYSKKIAENIFIHENTNTPTAVFRACFISPSLCEPFPVWTYGYGGYCGILRNVDDGIIRHVAGNPDNPIEILPVDFIVNSLLSLGWYLGTGRHKDDKVLVLNVHSSTENPVTMSMLEKALNEDVETGGNIKVKVVSNRFIHGLLILTRYLIPSLLKDVVAIVRGEKPQNFTTHRRIRRGLKYLEKSTFKNATKDYHNARMVYNSLSQSDKQEFPFEVKSIQWDQYIRNWMKALSCTSGKAKK